jgi:hypothetical protein
MGYPTLRARIIDRAQQGAAEVRIPQWINIAQDNDITI